MEDKIPPSEVRRLVDHCSQTGTLPMVGGDPNAHYTVWGSTDINHKGVDLLDYLASTDLDVHNMGNTPTFRNLNRAEVSDFAQLV